MRDLLLSFVDRFRPLLRGHACSLEHVGAYMHDNTKAKVREHVGAYMHDNTKAKVQEHVGAYMHDNTKAKLQGALTQRK